MHHFLLEVHLENVCNVKHRSLRAFWPALVCAIFIFVLSIAHVGIQLPEVGISPDKTGHLLAYGTLAWLVFSGLKKEGKFHLKNALWAVTIVSLYGVLLEFVQWAFFPYRYFEVWDMVANITGACLSLLIFRLFIHKT